jgi:Arc/MetJ family transcription regulator
MGIFSPLPEADHVCHSEISRTEDAHLDDAICPNVYAVTTMSEAVEKQLSDLVRRICRTSHAPRSSGACGVGLLLTHRRPMTSRDGVR